MSSTFGLLCPSWPSGRACPSLILDGEQATDRAENCKAEREGGEGQREWVCVGGDKPTYTRKTWGDEGEVNSELTNCG